MAFGIESEEVVQTIGKLILFKNALIFENTAYQISNVCSMWVADHGYTIKHKYPNWIIVMALLGLVVIVLSLQQRAYIGAGLGLVILGVAAYGHKKYIPQTRIDKFALGLELNSGRRTMFTAPDKNFVQQAAHAIVVAIAEKSQLSQKVVMNFDNKSINIESVKNSNIIGGNVSDSIVENI